ncbi:MAG: hypothetical protein COB24_11645 [Hyphomicrobiales bacterium]|nr:MAG: hypothetical protein COB24_11645 [Hyphomicrobiales bacterium]
MRYFIAVLVLISSQFAMQALAHEGVKYRCGFADDVIEVEFFADENRAQITNHADRFGVIYNDKDGYLNVFKQAQFYPEAEKTRLYIGMKQYNCGLYVEKPVVLEPAGFGEISGKSLGGKVRDKAGMNSLQVGSLFEGNSIVITGNSGVDMNGYDWFEIEFGGRKAYQWGGIMCSDDVKIAGIFMRCE